MSAQGLNCLLKVCVHCRPVSNTLQLQRLFMHCVLGTNCREQYGECQVQVTLGFAGTPTPRQYRRHLLTLTIHMLGLGQRTKLRLLRLCPRFTRLWVVRETLCTPNKKQFRIILMVIMIDNGLVLGWATAFPSYLYPETTTGILSIIIIWGGKLTEYVFIIKNVH